MKKSFMTRVLAVSLSAAMAFSLSSANLVTASAATTVSIAKTKTVTVGDKSKKLKLKNNTQGWKIFKATSNKKAVCKIINRKPQKVTLNPLKAGTATITVKVRRTTKKGVLVNKNLKCKVTVKAKPTENKPGNDEQNQPSVDGLKVMSVVPSDLSTVVVRFNKAVDAVDASNFDIAGATVSNAVLSADGTEATLTVSGLAASTKYTVKVTGLKANGESQGEDSFDFTTPVQNIGYSAEVTATGGDVKNGNEIKADNSAQATITFVLKDENGNVAEDVSGLEVLFSTTHGDIPNKRVTVDKGRAETIFRSEFRPEEPYAVISAEIIESERADEIGASKLNDTYTLHIVLEPKEISNDSGARLVDAEAETADRIIAFFDRNVNAADYMNAAGTQLNKTLADIDVWYGLNNSYTESTGTKVDVAGVLPYDKDPKALQILLKTPLKDNSNIRIKFADKTKSVRGEGVANFKLTDARQPSVYRASNVNAKGETSLRNITVEFSEAVLSDKESSKGDATLSGTNQWVGLTADKFWATSVANYRIDGRPLTYYGGAVNDTDNVKAKVEALSRDNVQNARNQVTIELGKKNGKKVYLTPGLHFLEVSNVGDWAAWTDGALNAIATQTIYFDVVANEDVPTATVQVQSPEQYLIEFNTPVEAEDGAVKDAIELQFKDPDKSNKEWQGIDKAGKKNQETTLARVDDDGKVWLMEVKKDWTQVWSGKNYSYYKYRIHVDADKLYNAANGKKNEAINEELGDAMLKPDVTSPKITSITRETNSAGAYEQYISVELSEPMQILNMNGTTNAVSCKDGNPRAITTPNTTELAKNGDVPSPVVTFYNLDTGAELEGQVDKFLNIYDTKIAVSPKKGMKALTAGKWLVAVTAITDDVGNTVETKTDDTIDIAADATVGDFYIEWAAVGQNEYFNSIGTGNAWTGQYIFVKFSRPIGSATYLENALYNGNYTVNAGIASTGLTMTAGIKGYSSPNADVTDCITIFVGNGVNLNLNDTVLTVSNTLKSLTGQSLSMANNGNSTEYKLPFNYSVRTVNSDSAFKAAAEDESCQKIILSDNVSAYGVTINHPVTINVNNNKISGNVMVDYEDTGMLQIINNTIDRDIPSGVTSGTESVSHIPGPWTINTPHADVLIGEWLVGIDPANNQPTWNKIGNDVKVNDIIITDILENTLRLGAADVTNLVLEASGNVGVALESTAKIKDLVISGGERVSLANAGTISKLSVKETTRVDLASNNGMVGWITDVVVSADDVVLANSKDATWIAAVTNKIKAEGEDLSIVGTNNKSIPSSEMSDKVVASGANAINAEFAKIADKVTSTTGGAITILASSTGYLTTATGARANDKTLAYVEAIWVCAADKEGIDKKIADYVADLDNTQTISGTANAKDKFVAIKVTTEDGDSETRWFKIYQK